MKVKQVLADYFYQKKYVEIDGQIVSFDYAYEKLPSKREAIIKELNKKYSAAANLPKIVYREHPSNEQMRQVLLAKRKKIISELQKDVKILLQDKITQAEFLFKYLIRDLKYDMSSIEELEIDVQKIREIDLKTGPALDRISLLYKEIEENEGIIDNEKVNKFADAMIKLSSSTEYQNLTKQQNRIYLKALYSPLIQNRGVCLGFSYAYSFMLEKMNIDNYLIEIKTPNEFYRHIFNLIEIKGEENTEYVIADLTIGTAYCNKEGISEGFGMAPQEILKNGHYVVSSVYKLSLKDNKNENELIVYEVSKKEHVKKMIEKIFSQEAELLEI